MVVGFGALIVINVAACKHEWLPFGAAVVEDRERSGIRQVFIELPEDKFTAENLERIFTSYRSKCVPQGLEVVVYSDRDLLRQRIERSHYDDTKEFTRDEAGRKATEKDNQQLNWPEGAFIATYSRFLFNEGYAHRLSKENIPTKFVIYDPSENPYKCAYEGNR